ncbi:adenylate/guanylate cyclase domain-containing protein [Spirochaeta cellobiosiphila]|uniref:adenylate/guanylate cyclase domain-containing protein n=1 Tax=Spirochaeta cellobiosiphila TaxID=504483 RepID=UPI000417AD9F|nr:hypothetical protein [Spirochaeta cellobiosiphila]
MLDSALRLELIEILNINFKSNDITEIGKALFRSFDLHDVSDTRTIVTISDRKAAEILVDYVESKNKTSQLIEFLIQIDGLNFQQKPIELQGIEGLLERLSLEGMVYSLSKRKMVKTKEDPGDMVNWGALKDGKSYPVTIVSIDICKNSVLVKKYGDGKMKKLYSSLWMEIRKRMHSYNGRIWHWAGDGGLIAFAMKDHAYNAVRFALEFQSVLPLFLLDPKYPIKDKMALRFGINSGKLTFSMKTGTIVSEVINYACHLEKQFCPEGQVAISGKTLKELPKTYQTSFSSAGKFEGETAYCSKMFSP